MKANLKKIENSPKKADDRNLRQQQRRQRKAAVMETSSAEAEEGNVPWTTGTILRERWSVGRKAAVDFPVSQTILAFSVIHNWLGQTSKIQVSNTLNGPNQQKNTDRTGQKENKRDLNNQYKS